MRSRVKASSAPNGSSISSTDGPGHHGPGERGAVLHAAGQLVRERVAELGPGRRWPGWRRPRRPAPGRPASSSPAERWALGPNSTFSRVVSHGKSIGLWKSMPRSGPALPPAGRRRSRCPGRRSGRPRRCAAAWTCRSPTVRAGRPARPPPPRRLTSAKATVRPAGPPEGLARRRRGRRRPAPAGPGAVRPARRGPRWR